MVSSKRIEVIREVDRMDRMLGELGDFIAYGDEPGEELARELDHYDEPKEALDDLHERRYQLTELLRQNPDREEFDV